MAEPLRLKAIDPDDGSTIGIGTRDELQALAADYCNVTGKRPDTIEFVEATPLDIEIERHNSLAAGAGRIGIDE